MCLGFSENSNFPISRGLFIGINMIKLKSEFSVERDILSRNIVMKMARRNHARIKKYTISGRW